MVFISIFRLFLTWKIIYLVSLALLAYTHTHVHIHVHTHFFWGSSIIILAQELWQFYTALMSNYGLHCSALKFYSIISILYWHCLRRAKKKNHLCCFNNCYATYVFHPFITVYVVQMLQIKWGLSNNKDFFNLEILNSTH